MTTLLALTAGALFAIGTYLVLQRRLSRIIIGIGLLGHGANLVIVQSGNGRGTPAFIGGDPSTFADPLPQSFILTAIVITFGVTAFLLSLAYRSWQLTRDDEVEDDVEDRIIARQGALDEEVGDEEALEREQAAEESGHA